MVPISAAKNEGIDELIDHALRVAKHRERPERAWISASGDGAPRRIHSPARIMADRGPRRRRRHSRALCRHQAGGGRRASCWTRLGLDQNEKETARAHHLPRWKRSAALDREAAMADMRYQLYSRSVCAATVVKPRESTRARAQHAASTAF
ncbi:MAG: hypothetical protein ACLVEX_00985 [Ruthenibacterium lactatiformans]